MKAIINGKVILPGMVVSDRALVYNEKIVGLCRPDELGNAQTIDAGGAFVSPGLIDMHIHGYLGEDVSDGRESGIRKMAEGIVKNGVTSWLPTTMTVSEADIRRALQAARALMNENANLGGARVLGVNLEGPYINPAKKGAQSGDHIRPLDPAFLREYQDVVRVYTVAPEMPGNLDGIRAVREKTNLLASIGHTAATYDQASQAIKAGVRHATHLFNAMTGLNHREPGVAGAVLNDPRVTAELIADCFHVHPALFEMVARLKGDKLILITDCTRAGGLADGQYSLGGQPIFVKGVECRLADGTIAGSVLKLNQAVRNMARHSGLPVYAAVNMASLNPATALGLAQTKGSLEPGKDADIVIAGDDFEVLETIVKGRTLYRKGA